MKRLGIAHKLWAVCLGFALPIAVMFVLMLRAKLGQIEFARQEIAGDAFQRPLEDVLEHVGKQRLSRFRYVRGQPGALAALRAENREVADRIEQVIRAQSTLGERLQFTPEGLGLRQRGDFTALGLRERWRALVADQEDMDEPSATAQYEALVAHIRTMITHAGDTSNLILDPDLDSYYLMDVTLLVLPQLEDRLQQITHDVEVLREGDRASQAQLMRFASQATFLEEADWGRVVASTKTALNEDRNFYGVSPTLSRSLSPYLASGSALATRIAAALRELADGRAVSEPEIVALVSSVERMADVVYAFHRASFGEEDRLLRRRIAELEHDLYLGCALAFAAVLVSSLLALALSMSMVRRVAAISVATQSFSQGNLRARVGAAGTDELGTLAASFDAMAERIESLNIEVQARVEQLAEANATLEETVAQRTVQLSERNASFKLILDNARDGMLTVDLAGNLGSERSVAVARWLGEHGTSPAFADYVRAHDPGFAADFESGIQQVADDLLPLEVALAQLPQSLKLRPLEGGEQGGSAATGTRVSRLLRAHYQPIFEAERVSRLLIVLSDATAELAAQKATAAQEEALRIFHACQHDRAGFLGFVLEAREMVESIRKDDGRSSVELARTIHTLKGNCALFGVFSLAALCHEIEHRMAEHRGPLSRVDIEQLLQAWEEVLVIVSEFTGESGARKLEVLDDEYATLFQSIARGTPRRELLVAIAKWTLEPVQRHFARLAEQARSTAKRLGKELTVQIEANDLRLCGRTWAPVWSTLAHVIRNAVDHGIEGAQERVAAGKSPAGRLQLRAEHRDGQFRIEIADDGRGIDWSRVAAKAAQRGLPCETRRDLDEALFTDGISTKEVVTNISGRGVGMATVRAECRTLGGEVDIQSASGAGTLVRCSFPDGAMHGAVVASVGAVALVDSLAPRALA
jgi:HPt (histidine-containing phosphotransfer) domain-containing protein/HAMP domain-containing protein